jgi:hypothetical protein
MFNHIAILVSYLLYLILEAHEYTIQERLKFKNVILRVRSHLQILFHFGGEVWYLAFMSSSEGSYWAFTFGGKGSQWSFMSNGNGCGILWGEWRWTPMQNSVLASNDRTQLVWLTIDVDCPSRGWLPLPFQMSNYGKLLKSFNPFPLR